MGTREELRAERPAGILAGFKNFLLQGDIIIIAIGLVIALAFSTLIKAFTDNIITPLVNAIGGGSTGLGFHVNGQLVNIGAFISAVIYFVIFMAVIYFVIVVPYRAHQKRRGVMASGNCSRTRASGTTTIRTASSSRDRKSVV